MSLHSSMFIVSGNVDKTPVTEMENSGSNPGQFKRKTIQNWYSQLPCLTSSN